MTLVNFFKDAFQTAIIGSKRYNIWMAILTFFMLVGAYAYSIQLDQGLSATGMHDRVSWGLYISNFTFLVGLAAAAVMLVLPAYVFKDLDFKQAVLIGEGLAVAALCMCLAFVVADLGGPGRAWHLIPFIGLFNWPDSMLSWDVLVLNGYLFLNLTIPFYILYMHYQGKEPSKSFYLPGVFLSIAWAIGIHMVTAFLYAGLPAKPFWNSSLLGPKFLASAFAAGPAMIIIVLAMVRKFTSFNVSDKTLDKISLIVTVAAQINLVMLISELFKEFYFPTHHGISAQYLYFGLDGKDGLVPWVWTAVAMNVFATVALTLNRFTKSRNLLYISCLILFVGIWIEKGMGLIIPGFLPGPYGVIKEYTPTMVEIFVTIGIWSMGAFIFSALAKVAINIELGRLRFKK
ncbi:hypothetical protein UJ101_02455 [Flavobacteriaceae bacterium UJ101]|nr:hypothetical protein UJ101_02455 [Flavobacteriaceae bacterium UJ101]